METPLDRLRDLVAVDHPVFMADLEPVFGDETVAVVNAGSLAGLVCRIGPPVPDPMSLALVTPIGDTFLQMPEGRWKEIAAREHGRKLVAMASRLVV